MATQNPIEQEGTYPLPEAQLDRFMFKLVVEYSGREELKTILDRTTTGYRPEIKPVMTGEEIVGTQHLVRRVIMAPHVQDYAIRLTMASHPNGPFALGVTNKYVRWGASPRAAQTLSLAAKLNALLDGRFNASFSDVNKVYLPAMRHRVLLNFEGEAEGVSTDDVLKEIIEKTPTLTEKAA
jgi:MoxR-like ATPase